MFTTKRAEEFNWKETLEFALAQIRLTKKMLKDLDLKIVRIKLDINEIKDTEDRITSIPGFETFHKCYKDYKEIQLKIDKMKEVYEIDSLDYLEICKLEEESKIPQTSLYKDFEELARIKEKCERIVNELEICANSKNILEKSLQTQEKILNTQILNTWELKDHRMRYELHFVNKRISEGHPIEITQEHLDEIAGRK